MNNLSGLEKGLDPSQIESIRKRLEASKAKPSEYPSYKSAIRDDYERDITYLLKELDRLRGVLETAPHGSTFCQSSTLTEKYGKPYCECWKSQALKEGGE